MSEVAKMTAACAFGPVGDPFIGQINENYYTAPYLLAKFEW